ncbi:uncharacterized protein LOC110285148 [Mus caroli]|uniref:Uncharacterized protein LOC110285148 n=1 Tax=Mus caroli TaxID=10089 RepID=A0A6P5NXC7_MUSCR|nr:uncharacterized protein LOC110285148 [Mus caroli]
MLASVGQGYNTTLLLQGQETEAPRFVPQRLLHSTDYERLCSASPYFRVVKDASEVEVSDAQAASEMYLKAAGGEGRDCPLLQVLAGAAAGEEVEGSLPWIISWLLEANSYRGVLLRLDPRGSSLSLLQNALLGASRKRMQVNDVKPTLWNAVEEMRARRATLKMLRLGLLGDALTDSGLNQLGRALWELQVVKAWGPRSHTHKGARDETVRLLEPQVKGEPLNYCKQGRHSAHLSEAGRRGFLGSGLRLKHPLGHCEEQAHQVPDVALQFSLAQARRQRLREEHQMRIQEELKHLEHRKEVACEQIKGTVAEEACMGRESQRKEQAVLKLQVEALQAERDVAEQDLVVLYDLYVQATRARTCHLLQVFQAWQRMWEEKAMVTEHHYRSLLAGILQGSIDLALKNQQLQAQNQQLEQSADRASRAGVLPGETSDPQHSRATFLCPHS